MTSRPLGRTYFSTVSSGILALAVAARASELDSARKVLIARRGVMVCLGKRKPGRSDCVQQLVLNCPAVHPTYPDCEPDKNLWQLERTRASPLFGSRTGQPVQWASSL